MKTGLTLGRHLPGLVDDGAGELEGALVAQAAGDPREGYLVVLGLTLARKLEWQMVREGGPVDEVDVGEDDAALEIGREQ